MLNIDLSTPSSVIDDLKLKFRQRRLHFSLTQEGLARKSGVSLGSLKRFESSGQISLESLMKLSLVLECLDDFKYICNPQKKDINSIDDLLSKKDIVKKRGSIT